MVFNRIHYHREHVIIPLTFALDTLPPRNNGKFPRPQEHIQHIVGWVHRPLYPPEGQDIVAYDSAHIILQVYRNYTF